MIDLLLLSCKSETQNKFQISNKQMDSISIWIDRSRDASFSKNKRKEFLISALELSDSNNLDSLKTKALLNVAYAAYELGDTSFFINVNKIAQEACIKAKDTFGIADTHWNLATFFFEQEVLDSAYYHYHKAQKKFQSINDVFYSGRMLYNMALIQKDIKDYTGSETLTFQAIQKFKETNKSMNLYLCYNLLGVVFNEIEEYDKAIYYHKKAFAYLDDIENKKTYKEGSLNNLGLVYQMLKNYNESILYFEKALKNDNLKNLNILLYAKLLDNLAYTRLLKKDTVNLYPVFIKALKIRDSAGNKFGVSISNFHLSKYYLYKGDTAKAVNSALASYRLAVEVKKNKIVLNSLMLLAEIDHKNSNEYLERYIALNNELQNQERQQRNKFTRIRFETDEYIQEAERLDYQRKIVIALSLIVILILSLLFMIKRQRTKNKELQFDKEQQKANEEIYSLMLRQQVRLEEIKLKERNRIAEDLHDGVLGRIFGTRMGLGFLQLQGDEETLKKYQGFVGELQKIEKEIRDISHELKTEYFSAEFNFVILVENLLKDQSAVGQFEYILDCEESISWNVIEENVKINIYRLLQEAIYNVIKHAKASKLTVQFKLTGHALQLLIQDNGSGFNLRKKRKGIGLKNIKMRADKINAKFVLKSTLKEGTTLMISIPV